MNKIENSNDRLDYGSLKQTSLSLISIAGGEPTSKQIESFIHILEDDNMLSEILFSERDSLFTA